MPKIVLLLITLSLATPVLAEDIVHRSETCGCCELWRVSVEQSDFHLQDNPMPDQALYALKDKLGIPPTQRACHTAEIDGYVIEGHVPVWAIQRLLEERPEGAVGLVVPGMPPSSPGMGGPLVDYDIYLLREDGSLEPYARARGHEEISVEQG